MNDNILSLLELQQLVAKLVQVPDTQNVWVTAELLDVAVRGGHCYMELLQKDERGVQVAKARGMIWANNYVRIDREFYEATGQRFASGLKVMLRVSASMHPVYGFSLVVNAVNPEYTMGDLLRRRREILQRLQQEGIIELNRQLEWPMVPQRIAVISAAGAAGYGDFMNQLHRNQLRLRFRTKLYPAVMQGASAPKSIIAALDAIWADDESWDGVVIIRGGGATSDLQAYEDYELAAHVAQFPLPVAIGIGHERDVTVLDWVANKRLKTPTAVAEWLVATVEGVLTRINNMGTRILQTATERVSGYKEQLAQAESLLPMAARSAMERRRQWLVQASTMLGSVSGRRIHPQLARMDMMLRALTDAAKNRLGRSRQQLDASAVLLEALSPMATLRRGYSITRIDGRAVNSIVNVRPGTRITTQLVDGQISSVAESTEGTN